MRILIASDHRGFDFKNYLIQNLTKEFSNIVDLGPNSTDSVDYPDYAHNLCGSLRPDDFGVLICGSGIGMSIAANRHSQVRAALCKTTKDAAASRQHNNANVIVLGADNTLPTKGLRMVLEFLNTKFNGGRHQNRINKINMSTK